MIKVDNKINSTLRQYGIDHFIKKKGIITDSNERIKIGITYNNDNFDFTIRILENDIQKDVCGFLETDFYEIPIFEIPVKINSKGKPLVTFRNLEEKFPCVVLRDNEIIFGFDIFNEIGRMLSGHLEYIWNSDITEQNQLKRIPLVDYYEKILLDCLNIASEKVNITLKHKALWPEGKTFAVCLTHDVDRVNKTYQYFTHFIKHLKNRDTSSAMNQITSILEKLHGNDPYWNFEEIMKLENELNVRSTFFFLDEKENPYLFNLKSLILFTGRYRIIDPKILKIIKKIHNHGWEVGLHGSYNSYKNKITLNSDKKKLESIIGEQIKGIRQHHLNLDIPQTWRLQEKVGFKYDTTLGFNNDIGFRSGTCFPFYPFDLESGKSMELLQIPLIILDRVVFSKKNAWDECKKIIEVVENLGGVLTILWHAEGFHETVRSNVYEKLIRFCKERNAWITSAGEIESWWRLR